MRRIALPSSAAFLVTLALGCEHPPAGAHMTTPGDGARYVEGIHELGRVRLRPDLCEGVAEDAPTHAHLDHEALVSFLKEQGLQTTVLRARSDLVYVDVTGMGGSEPTRLRVAILDDPRAAGQDLHRAILEHGAGSWGVHRSNLAVLAPIGSLEQILEFAGRTKLACWGVLTISAEDDDFVVPGGYMEF